MSHPDNKNPQSPRIGMFSAESNKQQLVGNLKAIKVFTKLLQEVEPDCDRELAHEIGDVQRTTDKCIQLMTQVITNTQAKSHAQIAEKHSKESQEQNAVVEESPQKATPK